MIEPGLIKDFYPPFMWENVGLRKYIIKEYIQLLILDYLSATAFIKKIVLIGGTNLRLVKGIDRFSEDLDFDCKDLSDEEFIKMTDDIIMFLQRYGFRAEAVANVVAAFVLFLVVVNQDGKANIIHHVQ